MEVHIYFNYTATTEIYTYLTHSFPTRRSSDLGHTLRARRPPRPAGIPAFRRTPHPPGSCRNRSEEHTSELQSLMRISYAVFCLKKKNNITRTNYIRKYTSILNYQYRKINISHNNN